MREHEGREHEGREHEGSEHEGREHEGRELGFFNFYPRGKVNFERIKV